MCEIESGMIEFNWVEFLAAVSKKYSLGCDW